MSIYFYGCITMDGCLADKNHGLEWLYQSGTPEETSYDSFYKSMDITIMGKRTYDEIKNIENISSFYSNTVNYVFTHTEKLSVKGFIPVNEDVAGFVGSLEKEKNVWIIGGNTILAPLLDSDMIDVIVMQVAPVLLGAGIPLFTQKEGLKRFQLEKVEQYGQFAELIYKKQQI